MEQPNTSVHLAQEPRPGWTKLPNAVYDLDLTPRELQVLGLILSYRWGNGVAYPRVRLLAQRLRCSVRTIQRTIGRLAAKGALVIEERFRDADGSQASNVYHPGPLVAPLLSAVGVSTDRRGAPRRHPPVTSRSGRDKDSGVLIQRRSGRNRPPNTHPHYGTLALHLPGGP